MKRAAALLALFIALPAWAGACRTESAQATAALVELYTAASCSGCRRAEGWLAALALPRPGPGVVAVSLHVDYRDYLARGTQPAQRRFSLLQRMALVFTPRVLLQGRDFADWESAAFDAAVAQINARAPAARLALEIRAATSKGLATRVEAQVLDAAQRADAALYLAAFKTRSGTERVVLEWQGPIAAREDGHIALSGTLALLPSATPGTSGVAAFVQNRRTGDVLQALLLPACSP